jgi:hypothetical protein
LRYIGSCDRIIALVGDAYGFEPEETARPDRTTAPFLYPVGVLVRHGRAARRVTPTAQGHLSLNGSPEFLAMHPVSQASAAAQLQQEFIKELYRSGKDRNQFGLLHELRALVLRDGFRLRTRAPQARNLPYTSLGRLFKGREHILESSFSLNLAKGEYESQLYAFAHWGGRIF